MLSFLVIVQKLLYVLIILFVTIGYASSVLQMIWNKYTPSFFSRGIWFLLTINNFASVLLGDGSKSSVILAGTFFIGSAALFVVSYWKGSREFKFAEKMSLFLLIISGLMWVLLDAPFIGLVIGLIAHFIGGIPTIWRVIKRPSSEQAYHWYFSFTACLLTILASEEKHVTTILFPAYFALFDGLIIFLVNRRNLKRTNKVEPL